LFERLTVSIEIQTQLLEIENAYYDGATYDALCEKIVETAKIIAALRACDPDRDTCEVYAPLLWGGASGATIEPSAVKAALAGTEGASHLQSWAGMGRVLMTRRAAA
jgi:hypothetical protein